MTRPCRCSVLASSRVLRARSHAVTLVCLLLTTPLRAGDATAQAILKAVAIQYGTVTDYYLEVRTISKSSLGQTVESFDFVLAASRPFQFMLRQRSRSSDRFELLIVADDSSAWGYLPLWKVYTKVGAGRSDERDQLKRLHERFFGRFRLLDRVDAALASTGSGRVRSGGKSKDCIRIRLISSDRSWTEELWIDAKLNRILKSVFRRRLPFPESGDVVSTSVWRECRLNEPVDAALFRFEPPRSAHRTNTLEYR